MADDEQQVAMTAILEPSRLWSRDEVLARPCPIPRESGLYGWYFSRVPVGVPIDGCVAHDGHTLLYAGIAPKAPAANGKTSTQTLRDRIRYHYRGNAEGSTLRLTLGCLLADELELELRRVGSGRRLTFHDGEARLSEWMGAQAKVVWLTHPRPWELESELIGSVALPLNLDQNRSHPFHSVLTGLRRGAKAEARRLPTV